VGRICGLHAFSSARAEEVVRRVRQKVDRGERAYVLGVGAAGHNSGASLVELSRSDGINLLASHEEERFVGVKNYTGFPHHSMAEAGRTLAGRGLTVGDIDAFVGAWDYLRALTFGLETSLQEAPVGLALMRPAACPPFNIRHVSSTFRAPHRLMKALNLARRPPFIGVGHHDGHAAYAFGVSPFARSGEPALVFVLDGFGDDASISVYRAQGRRLERVYANRSLVDSLGLLYAVVSSTQGGWPALDSEGKYMGAAAYGDMNRGTNRFYARLREILGLEEEGRVYLNRSLADWHRKGYLAPYRSELAAILGAPKPPGTVVDFADTDWLDRAAATQMVLEDGVAHVIEHWVRHTTISHIVLSGGVALNCLCNMRVVERLDEAFFERECGVAHTRAHVWAPPNAGDAGSPAGGAFAFAHRCGVGWGAPLQHAFYCGPSFSSDEIRRAVAAMADIDAQPVGEITIGGRSSVAGLLAWLVARKLILGLFHGVAEMGPRALGHRSIVANACAPDTLDLVNARVKYREPFRPLGPMVTLDEARRSFELEPGAADDEFNAYRYMILTVRARPGVKARMPAAVHHDGTSRIQIVHAATDPFVHAFLVAMGRQLGVEAAINTSLNVHGPIVQTPAQALDALRRSRGLDGMLLVGTDGQATLAWDTRIDDVKDGGRRLQNAWRAWVQHARSAAVEASNPVTSLPAFRASE
jgi:carbamoyltransferase